MTHDPENPDEPADGGSGARGEGADRKLDEDAAWRSIVEHYGERADLGDAAPPEPPTGPTPEPPADPRGGDARLRGLFRPSWSDPLDPQDTDADADEGHFVPPVPGPMPPPDPRRRLAWCGLFGSPALMLVAVVLGWTLPGWVMAVLVTGFVGGFVYLVATMQDRHPGDGPDDNGAVV